MLSVEEIKLFLPFIYSYSLKSANMVHYQSVPPCLKKK